MAEALLELQDFLGPGVRPDVLDQALAHVISVSGDDEGRRLFLEVPSVVEKLLVILGRWQAPNTAPSHAKDAALALINLSATPLLSDLLIKQGSVEKLVEVMLAPESPIADPALMALCNLTRGTEVAGAAWERLESHLPALLKALTKLDHNCKGEQLHYLGPLIANLSQVGVARGRLLETALPTLGPFTRFEASGVRRGGVVSTLRNLCFEEAALEVLDDLLPALLLPLASAEPLCDEETEKLPLDLQFLPQEHKRESDPDLRRLLLEALSLLAASTAGREALRKNGVYLVLRELHKWEEDREALLACQNLAELLIRTEEEIGADNLHKLDIPEDLIPSFETMDKEFLKLV